MQLYEIILDSGWSYNRYSKSVEEVLCYAKHAFPDQEVFSILNLDLDDDDCEVYNWCDDMIKEAFEVMGED